MLCEKALCQRYALKVYTLSGMPTRVYPIDPITRASHTIRINAKITECTRAARLPIHLKLETDGTKCIPRAYHKLNSPSFKSIGTKVRMPMTNWCLVLSGRERKIVCFMSWIG